MYVQEWCSWVMWEEPVFRFLRNLCTNFYSDWRVYAPINSLKGSSFFTHPPVFVINFFLIDRKHDLYEHEFQSSTNLHFLDR